MTAKSKFRRNILFVVAVLGLLALLPILTEANPERWQRSWPKTDFSMTSVNLEEIRSGGPPKDGIPAIGDPQFKPIAEIDDLPDTEPVIGLVMGGEARAYPLRVLMFHEIVNDTIAGVPVAVTFCPLCNAAIVFDRRVDGQVLDFGTTGKLRNSDLVMYDRQTESWWQQFTGTAIVGSMLGTELKIIAARLESYRNFKSRAKNGLVLVPNNKFGGRYGANPYVAYDTGRWGMLYRGDVPKNIGPLDRVVTIEGKAWALHFVKSKRRLETTDGLIITWEPGQNSALDTPIIAEGVDVGNVVVQRKQDGKLVDVPYGVDFAFAFYAFNPDVPIIVK